jgi:hypothetical protein
MNIESALDPMIMGIASEPELRGDFYTSSAISAEVRIYDVDQLRSALDSSVTLAANDNTGKFPLGIDDTEWIGDLFEKLAAKIPPEEWEKLPRDMAASVDERLYGRER